MTIMGDNAAEDAEITEVVDEEIIAIPITAMTIKNEDLDAARDNVTQITVEGMVMIIHTKDEEDSGMEMTRITMTETIGIEIMIVKVILTEVDDGIIIVEVKDTVIEGEVDDGTPISSIMTQGTNRSLNFKTQITTDHPQWDINIDTQSHMVNTHTSPSNHSTRHKCQPPLNKPLIFVNCATVKVIMTTNANLQVILWHAHKKPLIKANHTVTKTLIMGNCHKVMVTTMTQMGNLSVAEDHDAADPPLRTLNVFYQGTNVEMLEETYLKFKKNILPKMKKTQPDFQEPVVEYCEPEQVIDICSYNQLSNPLDKSSQNQRNCNDDNDIYDTSELEHEFEYGIYEDVLKTEQLMAELKRIDEAENENKKSRDVHFGDFPLEQFSDAGKVANEGDPHLKAAADTELYESRKARYTN